MTFFANNILFKSTYIVQL